MDNVFHGSLNEGVPGSLQFVTKNHKLDGVHFNCFHMKGRSTGSLLNIPMANLNNNNINQHWFMVDSAMARDSHLRVGQSRDRFMHASLRDEQGQRHLGHRLAMFEVWLSLFSGGECNTFSKGSYILQQQLGHRVARSVERSWLQCKFGRVKGDRFNLSCGLLAFLPSFGFPYRPLAS
jgi:hypothetical protein